MPRTHWLVPYIICIILTFCGVSAGQLWSGVLDPARAIDWSQAGATIINRASVCATLNPGATASQITSAINSCNNGVVQLSAGTYNLSGSISTTHSNFTLRGAGPDQTFLVWSSVNSNCNGLGGTAICVWNGDSEYVGSPSNLRTWTASSYAKGTNTITLSSTANLKVGSLLVLDQTDPSSDTGNIWPCATSGGNGSCSQQGSNGVARSGRSLSQQVLVTACGTSTSGADCSSNTVTFSPGLYSPNWSSSRSPSAWYSSSLPVSGVGIENLSLDYRSASLVFGIAFQQNSTQSWVQNVRSINGVASSSANHHVDGWQATHITVRDSYFYGSNPASEGYGIAPSSTSADWLVENNICQHIATCTITQASVGNVFGYNYAVDNYFGGNWQQQEGFLHSAGDSYNLWEGHEGIGFDGDSIHGTHWMITHFRVYLSGHDPATMTGGKNQATFAYFPFSYDRYNNLVGSVLGTQSYHKIYQAIPSSNTDCGGDSSHTVMVLGYSDQGGTGFSSSCGTGSFTINNDTLVASTLMRWGNYAACSGDSACNAVRWLASENASGAPAYPGLSSPSETLPASFYHSSRPSFWGSMPWPAVGPDVNGGDIANVGGHAYHNPAGNCYLNIMHGKTDGSSGPLSFNADSCYGGATAVPAPTNLVATPH